MPVDVAAEEPRTRVVSEESDRHTLPRVSHAHNVTDDGVVKVVGRIASAADDMKCVAMQVDRVLQMDTNRMAIRPQPLKLE
jgi:hypothetical protein